MTTGNLSTARSKGRAVLTILGLAAVYWVVESLGHALALRGGGLAGHLFPADPHEIYNRLVVVACIALFGAFASRSHAVRLKACGDMLRREGWLNATLNAMGAAVLATDREGRLVLMNPAAERVTGWHRDRARGRAFETVFRVLGPDDRPSTADRTAEVCRSGSARSIIDPLTVQAVDGTRRPMAVSCCPIGAGGDDYQGMVVVAEDRSDERLREEILRKAEYEKAIILESVSEIILHYDRRLTVLWGNRAACESAGLPPDEMAGRRCRDIWRERPRLCADGPVGRALSTGGVHEEEIVDQNGRSWRIKGYPVFDEAGEVSGAVEVTVDVTEKNRAREALRKSEEQLYQAQRLQSMGVLVAGIAHEINNPLNLLMFNVPLFQGVWNDVRPVLAAREKEQPGRKYGGVRFGFLDRNLGNLLADMNMAATRIAKIVGDLKRFAKQPDATEKMSLDVNRAVKTALRLANATLKKSKVAVDLALDGEIPVVEGNQQHIEQVLLNLIINAFQAIDPAGGRIEIATQNAPEDEEVRISVTDDGPGIPPHLRDTLFDPFVTGRRDRKGTGLGLSVSYSLVKAHRGKIDFTTETGVGTTFRVTLPRKPKRKPIRVLIADDDASIRKMLTLLLTGDRAYRVEEAANGVTATIKLGTYRPDILILDLMMPGMDGLEVCRHVRSERGLSGVHVIITTGYAQHPMVAEIARLGFTDIVEKPVDVATLLRKIDALAERRV